MFSYIIKKNGYDLCRAKGKKEAISRIISHLDWSGSTGERHFKLVGGQIKCVVNDSGMEIIFTVEKC